MGTGRALLFEYQQRAGMYTNLGGPMRAQVEEDRDRQLEDYLANTAHALDVRVGPDGKSRPWNTAWGNLVLKRNLELSVTSGSSLTVAGSTLYGVTKVEPVTLVVGRSYRMTYFCRAWGVNAGAATAGSMQLFPYIDAISRITPFGDVWWAKPNEYSWQSSVASYVFDCVAGVGSSSPDVSPGAHTMQIVVQNGASPVQFHQNGSSFVIEDMGPIT